MKIGLVESDGSRPAVADLEEISLNDENPVTVDISAASSLEPNTFRSIATFEIGVDTSRTIRVLAHKNTPGTGAGTLLFY